MILYMLQVSNHPGAGSRIPTQDAVDSWRTVYDGPIASAGEARETVEHLARFYRHARAFRGGAKSVVGRLFYAILRMNAREEGGKGDE